MFLQKLLLGLLSVGSVALPTTPQMAMNAATDVPQTYFSYVSPLRFDCDVNGWLHTQGTMNYIEPLGSPSWVPITSDEYSYCFYSVTYKITSSDFLDYCWVFDVQSDSPLSVDDIFDYATLTYFAYFDVSASGNDRFQWYIVPYFHFKSSFLGVNENGFRTAALYWSCWLSDLGVFQAEELSRFYSYSSVFSGSISDLVDSLGASKFNRDRLPSLAYGLDHSYGSLPSNSSDVFFSPFAKPWKLSQNGLQIFRETYGNARMAAAAGYSWWFDGFTPEDVTLYERFNLNLGDNTGVPSWTTLASMSPPNWQDGAYVGDTGISAVVPWFEFYTYSFPLSQSMEVIDIWAMFSAVLTMPFTFVYQAFNITLFQGTMYEFAVGPFVYSVFGILIIVGIFGLIFSFLRGK